MGASETLPAAPGRPATRRKRSRSAVTSGRKQWIDGDPNSAWSRRYADVVAGHVADLTGGKGPDELSQAQMALIRRAAGLTCEIEQIEGRASQGETIDLDALGRAASHLRRILETLGINRTERKPMTFAEYAARIRAEESAQGN